MWNLSKLLSALWGVLGSIALLTLFIIYANFPDQVDLAILKLDQSFELDRQRFFMIFSGIFLTINLSVVLAIKAANALIKVSKSIRSKQHLKTMVAIKLLVCGANIFLITLMIFLKAAIETQNLQGSWQWMVLLIGPAIVVAGLLFLLFVVLYPSKEGNISG